ncbi:MAG: FAD-binding protein [archaeon]
MSAIQVRDTCTACEVCVRLCPFGAIQIVEGKADIGDACSLCGVCVRMCPIKAISIERPIVSMEQFTDYKGVWIVAEQNEGELKNVSFELLGEGKKLANRLGEELAAALIGSEVAGLAKILRIHGADKVYLIEHEALGDFTTDSYTDVLSGLITRYKPSIVLFGATINGRDLAPRVAARVRAGLTADCTGLEIDQERRLVQTRPAFGGNIMASIISHTRPQMATVRPRVMKAALPDDTRKPVVERVQVEINSASVRTRVLGKVKEVTESSKRIEDAEIIVSCGRGISKQEQLALIDRLAENLGAAVGGSRPLVDCGWLPHQQQVGQSGKTVAPKLYLAVGISGSIQHRIGMQSSDMIVAINKDPEAPIFSLADLGVVGDLFEIVPRVTEELQKYSRKK